MEMGVGGARPFFFLANRGAGTRTTLKQYLLHSMKENYTSINFKIGSTIMTVKGFDNTVELTPAAM